MRHNDTATDSGALRAILRLALVSMALSSAALPLVSAAPSDAIHSLLCGIVSETESIIGLLVLALFLIGGVFYALAHFLPAAGNIRSSMQAWSMNLLFAAIVALVIFIIANPLIGLLFRVGSSFGGIISATSCTANTASQSSTSNTGVVAHPAANTASGSGSGSSNSYSSSYSAFPAKLGFGTAVRVPSGH